MSVPSYTIGLDEQSPWYKEDVGINHFLQFVRSKIELNKKGLKLNYLDSKVYYKLRHNLLKSTVLSFFGFESVSEKPFCSFKQLALDSKRTPDFLMQHQDMFLMIEFTFSNRYESILRTKDIFSKYDIEIRDSEVLIKPYYVFMSLDRDLDDLVSIIIQISEDFGLKLINTFREELENVHKTVKSVTSYLYDFLPDLLSFNMDYLSPKIDVEIIEAPDRFRSVQQLVGKKHFREQRTMAIISRNMRSLLLSSRRKPKELSYKIGVNYVTGKCFLKEDEDGAYKDQLINLISMESTQLNEYIITYGDVYTEQDIFQGVNLKLLEGDLDREQDVSLKIEDDQYFNRYFNAIMSNDMKTVADFDLEVDSKKVSVTYNNLLNDLYSSSTYTEYKKSPFIFLPCDYLVKGSFKTKIETKSSFVNVLINKAQGFNLPRKTIIERKINYDEMMLLNKNIYTEGISLKKQYQKEFVNLRNLRKDKLEELFKNTNDEKYKKFLAFKDLRNNYNKVITEQTRQAYQNRVRINLRDWEDDIEHFKKVKNVYYVTKELDHSTVHDDFKNFMEELFYISSNTVEDNIFSDTEPLGSSLKELCNGMYGELEGLENIFKNTLLGHSTLLISQFSYSLLFYSNIKLNKDDFVYDNLGYNNVLLMVKGGKKIRSTRNSRFFRLLIPITHNQRKILNSNTNEFYIQDDQIYLLTPWRMLRLSYLKKGVEMYSNVGNYMICGQLESNLDILSYQKFMTIKILLMFSQRRKLEVWMSSLRYIYLNSLGTHTGVLDLLKDMVIHDTDPLIFLMQRLFMNDYQKIYNSAKNKKLYDLFWGNETDNFDLMAERFEETMFMAKSPFNPVNEHLKNLKSVLDTHMSFMEDVGTLEPLEVLAKTDVSVGEGYLDKLQESDFNFDSKLTFLVGDFAGKFISASKSKGEMMETFNKLLERNYTEIATSKGMRDESGQFWGQKGHDVVFGHLDIDVEKILNTFPDNPMSYKNVLSQNEISFFDKIQDLSKKGEYGLEFDMKDKEQYKGSREIYVMSSRTKLLQNPLEKFFASLCKSFPNELIHKPSSMRPKLIHGKIFEHDMDSGQTMYCTMDCRKWAPKSNLWKYYFFIKGMSNYLPENFTNYFFKTWSLMFTKRIRIQSHYVEKLVTNKKYENIKDFLIQRSDNDFELLMPYSFMMGIFNYLSSLLHAASQIYFADNIANRLNSTCVFLAHSDDSGGIIHARNYESCLKTYRAYEKFQKSLNHLMSIKKCCLSKRSFEIISIMYCDKRFIPMTHKFLSNVALDLKGSGWYDDITSVVGKIVDLYNNGGSFLQCYGMMLALSELYRKAYHLPRVKNLSQIPLAFGGVLNMHPIHLVLIGSNSQECLLDLLEDETERKKRIQTYVALTGDYTMGIGSKIMYQTPYYKRHPDALDLTEENRVKLSALATLPDKSTLISTFKHYNKLFDKKYVYSLTGVDSNQIFLSSLLYKHHIVMPNNQIIDMVDIAKFYLGMILLDFELTGDITYPKGNYMSYFKQTESLRFDYSKFNLDSTKSCKPVLYNTVDNTGIRISRDEMLTLSSIEKWSGIKNLFFNPVKYDSLRDYLISSLPGELEEKINYIKNYDASEKVDKLRSGYLFIPSQVKIDTPARFFTYTLLYTTRRYKISSQKPQLFTPSEFNLEARGYEKLKHKYLAFKLMEKDLDSMDLCKRTIDECELCHTEETHSTDLDLFKKYLTMPEFKDFKSNLPFVDYISSQFRGKNVWYSSTDFTIYTDFGNIESRNIEGETWTTWSVYDSIYLMPLWGLYRIFCSSRGIEFERPVFQDTGFSFPKLAFNNFDNPYIPQMYVKAMVLAHSRVIIRDPSTPSLHRRGNKIMLNDRVVDFKIYNIYDINHQFYESHNLKLIKEYIYKTDLEIDEKILLANFKNSRLYNLLLNDERHSSSNEDKYSRNGLLGQPGSLTRALTLSDEKKIIRYRSSYNSMYLSKGAIEFETVEGVPVLDMFEKINYSRMTAFEKMSFEKVLSGKTLNTRDKENLIKIKGKLGLESIGTAVVLHKHIFQVMMASSLAMIPDDIIMNVFQVMVDAIHDTMESNPVNNIDNQYPFSRSSWWKSLRCILSSPDLSMLDVHMTKGLIRSKADNEYKFWSNIQKDILLSSMFINSKYFLNLLSMLNGMVNKLKSRLIEIFFDGNQPRYRHLALSRVNYKPLVGDTDCINNLVLDQGEPLILDEDGLDVFTSEDVPEDEYEEREYDEDNEELELSCFSGKEIKIAMQKTGTDDFSRIVLRSPNQYLCFPWLGKGDYYFEKYNGIEMFISSFPGREEFEKIDLMKHHQLNTLEFTELLKDIDEVKLEKAYRPRSLKSRDEAVEVLKSLNIFIPKVVDEIFPKEGNTEFMLSIESFIDDYFKIINAADLESIINQRKPRKFHLPGFQGLLEDDKSMAELKALFAENSHYILSGNVRLTKANYNHFMKFFKRHFNQCNTNDRSLMTFLTSILLDTKIDDSSDSWFTDKVTQIIEEIDDRINPDIECSMIAVAPGLDEMEYKEKDMFD
jgi:hypothetical protein